MLLVEDDKQRGRRSSSKYARASSYEDIYQGTMRISLSPSLKRIIVPIKASTLSQKPQPTPHPEPIPQPLSPPLRPPPDPLRQRSRHLRPQHIPPKLLTLQQLQNLQRRPRIAQILNVGRPGPVLQVLEVGDKGGLLQELGGGEVGEVGWGSEEGDELELEGEAGGVLGHF